MARHCNPGLETGARIIGSFEVETGREIFGDLTLQEKRTRLYLRDDDFFHTLKLPNGYLKGRAHDLSCLPLFDCVTFSGPGTGSAGDQSYTFADLFPHHIAHGTVHLGPTEKVILSAIFSIDDGHAIFYDFDALGTVLRADPLIEAVANANRKITRRKIQPGERPRIHFHPGRSDLLTALTTTGRIKVMNLIDETMDSPRRMALESRIAFEISWKKPVDVRTALTSVDDLIRFLELIAGRPQNRNDLLLRVDGGERPSFLSIYSTMADHWERSDDDRSPGPHDVLIDGIRRRSEIGKVLRCWFAHDAARRDARLRFAHAFSNANVFSEDRLIGAANMFDLLPTDAVPKRSPVNGELAQAKAAAIALFDPLPDSPERHSILSALGRIGTASLPRKVLHRAKLITDTLPVLKPDMELVVREAIKCRNHYVHGSDATYDYLADGDAVPFFTSTLEFVFGASELIECGWNIGRSTGGSHPFAELLRSWELRVDNMKANLAR